MLTYDENGPVVPELACVAGGILDRVRVLCLWRMAERGNRGAARELGRSRELLELIRTQSNGLSSLGFDLFD